MARRTWTGSWTCSPACASPPSPPSAGTPASPCGGGSRALRRPRPAPQAARRQRHRPLRRQPAGADGSVHHHRSRTPAQPRGPRRLPDRPLQGPLRPWLAGNEGRPPARLDAPLPAEELGRYPSSSDLEVARPNPGDGRGRRPPAPRPCLPRAGTGARPPHSYLRDDPALRGAHRRRRGRGPLGGRRRLPGGRGPRGRHATHLPDRGGEPQQPDRRRGLTQGPAEALRGRPRCAPDRGPSLRRVRGRGPHRAGPRAAERRGAAHDVQGLRLRRASGRLRAGQTRGHRDPARRR